MVGGKGDDFFITRVRVFFGELNYTPTPMIYNYYCNQQIKQVYIMVQVYVKGVGFNIFQAKAVQDGWRFWMTKTAED